MQAIIRTKAGKEFSTMKIQQIASPLPGQGEVKVRMKSSRINPVDMDLMKGFPTLKYKKPQIGGVDGAGEIVAIGEGISNFRRGDQVFFYRKFTDIGTWAEEITIAAKDIAKIPNNLSVEQAGAIALPLLTAYESLTALAPLAGATLLIHGAGGGVGFQAVQLAKAIQLKVIANASERDKEKLEQAKVDQFINYKAEDFYEILKDNPPDYIFDVIGQKTLSKSIALKAKKVVSVAFPDTDKMWKTGVQLPGILKFIMKWMNRKFAKAAQKNQVELIGQVTGANGQHLDEAARLIEQTDYLLPSLNTLNWDQIQSQGLSKKDLGKVILFS